MPYISARTGSFLGVKNLDTINTIICLEMPFGWLHDVLLRLCLFQNAFWWRLMSGRGQSRQCIIKHGWNENNHVSIQHINLYKLSEVTASIIKYTSILIVNCLQELIKNLLNLQTRYPKATNKSYQNFITDIIKLK